MQPQLFMWWPAVALACFLCQCVSSDSKLGLCPQLKSVYKIMPVKKTQRTNKWFDRCDWRGGCYRSVIEDTVVNEGYQTTEWSVSCCPGYKHVGSKKVNESYVPHCVPTCPFGCTGGSCVAYDQCECPDGFILLNGTDCVPHCKKPCYNGKCIKPDTCECNDGFKFADGSVNECLPLCKEKCVNSYCSEPNICTCYTGFIPNNTDQNVCDPACSKPCFNATCVAKDTCMCDRGYKQFDQWSCHPICLHDCNSRGSCERPGKCSCPEGYQTSDCSPKCPKSCNPGACTSPGICTCPRGFTFKDNSCQPVCTAKCINATCVFPDVCRCWRGYKHSTNSECIPQCIPECRGGDCAEPGVCTCHEGLIKHPLKCHLCLPSSGQLSNSSVTIDMFSFKESENVTFFQTIPSVVTRSSCSEYFSELALGIDVIGVFCQRIYDSVSETKYLCDITDRSLERSSTTEITNEESSPSTEMDFSTDVTGFTDFTDISSTISTDLTSEISSTILSTETDNPETTEDPTEKTITTDKKITVYFLIPHFFNDTDNATCPICAYILDHNQWLNQEESIYFDLKECPRPLSIEYSSAGSSVFWMLIALTVVLLIIVVMTVTIFFIIKTLVKARSYTCNETFCQLQNLPND